MTGTINLGDEWEITADETVDDLVIRHKPTANSFVLGADGTFTPLPELAITSVTTVPDKAARLSVSAEEGDIVIQTDVSKTFVLTTNDPTVNSNWVEIQIDVLNTIDGQQITPSQVGTSSNRTDVVADTVDANQLTGVSSGGIKTKTRAFLSSGSSADPIPFDSVSYDPDNNFDTTNHTYAVPATGTYQIAFNVQLAGSVSAGSQATFDVNRNNSRVNVVEFEASGDFKTGSVTDVVELTSGDSITVGNESRVSITSSESGTFLSVIRLE